mgnify:CR=1 FL=1
MENKRALSDVVTTVLIILFAIVAVAIIGGIVLNQVNKAGGKIASTGICSELEIEPVKCSNSTFICTGDSAPNIKCTGPGVPDIRCISNNDPDKLCTAKDNLPSPVKLIARRGAGGSSLSVTALSAIFEKEDGTTLSQPFATTPGAYTTVTSPVLATATSANIRKAGLSATITDEKGNKINCDYYKTTKIDCMIA